MNTLASAPSPSGFGRHKGPLLLAATVVVLVVITWLFSLWDLDRTIAARFYLPGQGWFQRNAQPWRWLYQYGTIPGIVLTVLSLIGAVISFLKCPESDWHRYFMLVLLTSILAAGLLINGVLKPYWGRPRPTQIHEFGGKYSYRNAFDPGIPGKGKSFTCGHCTMGFLFVSLVYFRRKSSVLAWTGGIAGLTFGGLISAARVVQGAHFVTDCIWSLGIIWMVATVLYYYVLRIPHPPRKATSRLGSKQKTAIVLAAGLLTAALVLGFLTRRPFFETYTYILGNASTPIRELVVGLENDTVRTSVRYSDNSPLWVLIHSRGFAWPNASQKASVVFSRQQGRVYRGVYRLDTKGYFSELTHEIEVVVPKPLQDKLAVVFMEPDKRTGTSR